MAGCERFRTQSCLQCPKRGTGSCPEGLTAHRDFYISGIARLEGEIDRPTQRRRHSQVRLRGQKAGDN